MLNELFHQQRRRIIKDVGSKLLWSFEETVRKRSLVGCTPILDRREFAWVTLLEESAPAIRRELDAILRYRDELPSMHEISPDQMSITSDARWKTYFLYGFGIRSEPNCARCPVTARVLSQLPGITTAFFSILAPGKHIPRHRGVYKGLVRAHLGLKVPSPRTACRMEIEGQTIHWREGEAVVFDDTFQHEVWNDSSEDRVVLLLDVLRPLPPALDLLNRALIDAVAASPYVKDGEANEREWERRFAQALLRDAA